MDTDSQTQSCLDEETTDLSAGDTEEEHLTNNGHNETMISIESSVPVNIFNHSLNSSHQPQIIKPLPTSVVNKIAAGEIIHRPVNAIKELLENSLDAGATNIQVVIEDGGLESIQVIDNGHGISRFNADLLCQRHSTSKLSTSDDLNKIRTFGFRGEALASISAVSKVQVSTFNKSTDKIGWQAQYKVGLIESGPQDKYISPGTKIFINKIFDDIPIRKKALKSLTEERKLITDLVTKYALHNCHKVTMSLREAQAPCDLICLIAPSALKSAIGIFYGPDFEKNACELSLKDDSLKFSGQLLFSYANSNVKRFTFILFINDRLVECPELKKDLDALLIGYLSGKQMHRLVYIRLEVRPADMDVNVHPAKTNVTLHYQSELIELHVRALKARLDEEQNTKNVHLNESFTQPTLSEVTGSQMTRKRPYSAITIDDETRLRLLAPGALHDMPAHTPPKRPSNLIHSHHSERKLTELFNKDSEPITLSNSNEMNSQNSSQSQAQSNRQPIPLNNQDRYDDSPSSSQFTTIKKSSCSTPKREVRRSLNLRSIRNLREEVGAGCDRAITNFLKETVFVGSFNGDYALIQNSTKLYVIKLHHLLKELYYQLYLYDFGNFKTIELDEHKQNLNSLISPHVVELSHDFKDLKFASAESIINKLVNHAPMLKDYFSISLNNTTITTIPSLVPGEEPNYNHLGKFLARLANFVNWDEEQECFKTIGRAIADFYSIHLTELNDCNVQRQYNLMLERKLFPLIKQYLFVPRSSVKEGNFYQISDTTELYKVFERC